MSAPIWRPSPDRVQSARLTGFLQDVARDDPAVVDFASLYDWSIAHPSRFWERVWQSFDVVAGAPYEEVLDDEARMPGASWFRGATLNFAENLLRHADEWPAIVSWNEAGRQRELTYATLRREVACVAQGLRAEGVRPGDRVAGFMPNIPEAVVAMLATTSLGATWSSCSPDFGVKGVLDRFGQIEPRVLFTADAYLYAGKRHDSLAKAAAVVRTIGSIERVVVVPYMSEAPDLGFSDRAVLLGDLKPADPVELRFERLPFDHPLYVMYSSGTTGLPKCIVHGAGGTLLQHLKELGLHTDLRRDERIFYFTTCGWMMWNWLVSSLALGATLVLYDGSPFEPRPDILMEMAERERVSVFGTSGKYLALLEKEGVRPRKGRNLKSLRAILSTGSPLTPESYDYVYRHVKEDVQLASITGGTDLISCFALGNPIGPVYRGELQARGLGMKVEVFDADGRSIVGEKGELVCTKPFPSMPVGFWDDPDGAKYRAAYFDFYPGVWRHGDWAEITAHGGVVIHGRSDATLNPGGVRIGTAEIYRQVEQLDDVLESIVIGQEWDEDVRIILFVRLRDGVSLDAELCDAIRSRIRRGASPHHVPRKILQVADIPRTLSGKISELAVRAVVHGRPVENREALANPESLNEYQDLEELQT